ncbi:MAG: phage tail protein [Alphaproteobacteria bacterium]|nr:phage tail protein [Alphaproteobacteria bacterium]
MSDPFTGQIRLFPYSFAPLNWADCAGQLVPVSQYPALFSLLGTTYGGDGTHNFALPDLQGRAALGQGTLAGGGTYALGQKQGAEYAAVTPDMMPPHSHALNASSAWGTSNTPKGGLLAQVAGGDLQGPSVGNIYKAGRPNVTLQSTTVAPVGGQQPHNNMQPSLALRYCICLQGIFPSRP